MAMLVLTMSRQTRTASDIDNAQRAAMSVLRRHRITPTDAAIGELRWGEFEKIDLTTLTHFQGAKSDRITWRQFGHWLEIRSALFALKASFECGVVLEAFAAAKDDVRVKSELSPQVAITAQQLGDAMQRLTRVFANMATANAWAKGMGAITGPRDRNDAQEAERKKQAVRAVMPKWNRNTASRLAAKLNTTPKHIRAIKKKNEPIP